MTLNSRAQEPQSLVIVGASIAGLRAVESARREGYAGPIVLIGAEPHLPYNRPPLSKVCLDVGAPPDTTFRTEEALRDDFGVTLALGCRADRIDTTARTVVAGDREFGYDRLIIATGAHARSVPGTEGLAGVHSVRTVDHARAVREGLDTAASVVVIGCGFVGSEVAASARRRGLPVTIVEAAEVPLVRAIGAAMGSSVGEIHARGGTDLRVGVGVARFEGENGAVRRVVLTDGTVLDADLVVTGIGATPTTDWLDGSGLILDDGVRCDSTLAAIGADGVYAAGDIARWYNPLFDTEMRIEHWTTAAEQGTAAARNALSPSPKPFQTVPYFWSDIYDHRLQFVGVAEADESQIALGSVAEGRMLVLYRRGDRLGGALAFNMPAACAKLRALIARRGTWTQAWELVPALEPVPI